MKVSELIKHLNGYDQDAEVAYTVWQRADVKHYASEVRDTPVDLSDEACDDILSCIDRHMDCSLGINWDTIEAETDAYIKEQGLDS